MGVVCTDSTVGGVVVVRRYWCRMLINRWVIEVLLDLT